MRILTFATAATLAAATLAGAEPVDGKSARKMLFFKADVEVRLTGKGGLDEATQGILKGAAAQMQYYGAIAISPSEGIGSEASVAGANFHSLDDARRFALENCNARRAETSDECVIVAEALPEGWQAQPLQLSAAATEAMRKEYRKGRGDKAMVISPSTGEWAIAKGDDAAQTALADCAARSAAGDCVIAVAD